MRVAVVDLGTNTCRLCLADVGEDGVPRPEARLTTIVRLGQGVDRSGRLHPDAVTRTMTCLRDYVPRIEVYGPARRLLVGTSVLRVAADGREFLARVERELGLPSRILSGGEEGALAFRGGTADMIGAVEPLVLVDIGGGSTEFAAGVAGREPDVVRSLEIGVVRLKERHLHRDPPPPRDVAALAADARASIATGLPAGLLDDTRVMVGVAGTYTTLVAHKLGLRRYDPRAVHGHPLTAADIDEAVALFATMTSAEICRRPGIQRGREDVILAGAVIAREALRAAGLGVVRCSDADILEGAALALAEGTLTPS